MTYDIHITRAAERDLMGCADYIEFVLLDPPAADDLFGEAEENIGGLSAFPEEFALVDDPVLKAWDIRFARVNYYTTLIGKPPAKGGFIIMVPPAGVAASRCAQRS